PGPVVLIPPSFEQMLSIRFLLQVPLMLTNVIAKALSAKNESANTATMSANLDIGTLHASTERLRQGIERSQQSALKCGFLPNEFNQDCRSIFDSSVPQLMFRQSWTSNRPPLFSRSKISRRKKERSSVENDPSKPGRSWMADLNFSLALS